MKRVAVFGNAGGGKSTVARKLAELTRIPLYPLDMIQFRAGGGKVPHDQCYVIGTSRPGTESSCPRRVRTSASIT